MTYNQLPQLDTLMMMWPTNGRLEGENNTSKTDVAPWCYKWVDWTGWKSPGGGMYRAPHGANKRASPIFEVWG